jgi:hypothetical protein
MAGAGARPVRATAKRGMNRKMMKTCSYTSSSREEIEMDRSSGSGLSTGLPSHHGLTMTVVMRLSLPSRLRGSGGVAPLFHTSILLRLNEQMILLFK